MINNSDLAKQWQHAAAFFKKHFTAELSHIQQLEEFMQLTESVKHKVIKLFTNKELKNTLLEQPNQHLIGQELNQDMSGIQIGSYQLIQLIAHGGMSSVYRARKNDIQSQKDVAIKLIPTNLQTTAIITLFKQELETLSQLHHPNIISMHHGDVSESGTPYLVMELVENALEIDQYFKQHQTSANDIIEHFITLCHVIDYAHQNNIIHQDIKPSNVLMDEHGHLLVLDFGVAALTDVIPDHKAYTLSYAAPEQTIKNQLPRPSFDTFAITSLLIKCLSQMPDEEKGWQSKAIKQLKIDHDLRLILAQGTATLEEQRYHNAADLALDLSLWSNKMPISQLRASAIYRFKKFIIRNPTTSIFAILLLLSMALGMAFYQQQYHFALSESVKAQQVKNILIEAIDQNDPDISKGSDLTVRDMLKQVERSHAENPTNDDSTANELYLTLAQAFNKAGDYESTENNILKVLNIDSNNIEALLQLAELKTQMKEVSQAKNTLVKLNQLNTNLTPKDSVRMHLVKANIAVINSQFEIAMTAFTQAQEIADMTHDKKLKIKVLSAHANGLNEQHQVGLSIDKSIQAMQLSQIAMGEEHSLTLALKYKLAETYLNSDGDDIAKANAIFETIIPQQKSLLGNNHPNVAKSLFLNSTALRALNKISMARDNAQQALSIAQDQFGTNHIFTAKVLMSLAGIYITDNNLQQAIDNAQMAVQIHENHLGNEHPETLQYKTSYIAMLVKAELHDKALELLLDIHPIQTNKLGPTHRGTLYVEIILSRAYLATENIKQAVKTGERCLKNAQLADIETSMEVYCGLTLENAYFHNKQYTESKQLIDQFKNDPLITNQPKAVKQFQDHLDFINNLTSF